MDWSELDNFCVPERKLAVLLNPTAFAENDLKLHKFAIKMSLDILHSFNSCLCSTAYLIFFFKGCYIIKHLRERDSNWSLLFVSLLKKSDFIWCKFQWLALFRRVCIMKLCLVCVTFIHFQILKLTICLLILVTFWFLCSPPKDFVQEYGFKNHFNIVYNIVCFFVLPNKPCNGK